MARFRVGEAPFGHISVVAGVALLGTLAFLVASLPPMSLLWSAATVIGIPAFTGLLRFPLPSHGFPKETFTMHAFRRTALAVMTAGLLAVPEHALAFGHGTPDKQPPAEEGVYYATVGLRGAAY